MSTEMGGRRQKYATESFWITSLTARPARITRDESEDLKDYFETTGNGHMPMAKCFARDKEERNLIP